MPAQHDDALCLRQWDWSETSQTAVLLTRSMGVLRVLAKGSKRPKSPYSGGLEMLTRGQASVIVRPNTELALLTEWDLLQSFPALRQSYHAHSAGLYVADLLMHMVHDHDPHPGLYDAAVQCLTRLEGHVGEAVLQFQWCVICQTGMRPVIDADVRTGEALSDAPTFLFDPSLGGVIEAGTPAPGGGGGGGGGGVGAWGVRRGTLDLLGQIDAPDRHAAADDESIDRANRLLASYIRHILGEQPPTMSVLFPGGLSR